MFGKKLFVIFLLLLGMAFGAEVKKNEINWLTLDEAMIKAKKDKKPIFVYLYSNSCGWCKRFVSATLSDTTIVKSLNDNFYIAKLNTGSQDKQEFQGQKVSEQQIATMFAVRGVPTSAFMDFEGNLISKLPGYIPPDKFTTVMKYIGEGWYNEMSYDDYMKSDALMNDKK